MFFLNLNIDILSYIRIYSLFLFLSLSLYLYIYIYVCVCVCVCEDTNIAKRGIRRMILFISEIFANIKYFGVYIKLISGRLICEVVSFELFLFFKWKRKNKKTVSILC